MWRTWLRHLDAIQAHRDTKGAARLVGLRSDQTKKIPYARSHGCFSPQFLSYCLLPGVNLIEEHLREVRCLRQRLEESIRTNERLRQQLEERLTTTGRDGGAARLSYFSKTFQSLSIEEITP